MLESLKLLTDRLNEHIDLTSIYYICKISVPTVADEKEQSIPDVKPLSYSVEVIDGLMFDPSMSANIRMTADTSVSGVPILCLVSVVVECKSYTIG